jgi:hypothetical protein
VQVWKAQSRNENLKTANWETPQLEQNPEASASTILDVIPRGDGSLGYGRYFPEIDAEKR